MDYEKRYNEIVKAVKELRDVNPHDEGINEWINDKFPELAESEDEIIISALKSGFKFLESEYKLKGLGGIKFGKILAWIEKHGETFTKKDVDDAYLKGICDAKHELEKQNEKNEKMKKEIAEFIFNSKEHIKYRYDWIKCLGYDIHFIDKEKQGEQNPVKEYNITDIGSKNAQGKLGEMIKLCMEKPKWCNYPDANKPIWGCWSLLNGKVTSEDYCKDCERYKKNKL